MYYGIPMESQIFYLSCKIHGLENIGDSSNSDGDESSDDRWSSMRPPPIPYDVFKDRIVTLGKTLLL